MNFVRINISLPKEVFKEIPKNVGPRKKSRFITEAITNQLKKQKAEKLAAEYEEASAEILRITKGSIIVLTSPLRKLAHLLIRP